MTFKPKALSMAMVAICSAGSVLAGGMEVTRLPTDMMFEKGNYASISFGRFSPDVTDDKYATKGSMYKNRSALTLTFKAQLNDRLSVGLAKYKSAEISLDYAASEVPQIKAVNVDLSVDTIALLGRYKVDENFSMLGGLKYSTGSGGGNVGSKPLGVVTAAEDSVMGAIVGVSYEKPEIALRVSGIYQAKQEMMHPSSTNVSGKVFSLNDTKSALPASFTLDFQSGIAANTLLFGSIHRALWSSAHIFFDDTAAITNPPYPLAGAGGYVQKSTWTDTTSLSLGIGRKLSDQWAVSASLNYEAASEPAGTSPLSTTDGVRGITLGGKYTRDGTIISAGINYSRLGDKTVTSMAGAGKFTGNSVTTIGVKIGQNF
jgi:long-chain fatty acid transport protein